MCSTQRTILPSWFTWKWAAAVGAPFAAYYLFIRGAKISQPNDFNSFLKAPASKANAGRATGKKVSPNSFDSFLKVAQEKPNKNEFGSFLKNNGAAAVAVVDAAEGIQAAEKPSPDAAKVCVMYGTEYGFSKEIAEKLCTTLKETKKIWPVLHNMADYPSGYDLSKEQAVFMICSTQGDGVPPTEPREFCEWLFADKAGKLPNVNFSVCALGDKTYAHFCSCGKAIDSALERSGALRVVEREDVNREDWKAVDAWIAAVVVKVQSLGLKSMAETGGIDEAAAPKVSAAKPWGRSRPFKARVAALEGLCTLSGPEDKNVVRAEFDLAASGITYLPGDALGIYPSNPQEAVTELLQEIGCDGSEVVKLPSWHYEAGSEGTMNLRDALMYCYDIRSPKPDIFKLLLSALPEDVAAMHVDAGSTQAKGTKAEETTMSNGSWSIPAGDHNLNGTQPEDEASQLKLLISDDQASDAYLAIRHVIDVLQDFPSACLTTTQLLSVLRQLQPRLYSISSSPLEGPAQVQATVAEVKYKTLGRGRVGVCSTLLSDRIKVGDELPIYIHKNPDFRLPADPATPIIMVGPGTGLAPFRSFIQERVMAGVPCGQMVLYFGCRRSDQDYLYGDLLEGWAKDGKITLFTAFSRQQAQKVYVQNRLQESAALVWQLLQEGGHFYVCGDASSMAGQVEEVLLQILGEQLGGAGPAKEYLDAMSKTGRYQRDVWY